MICDFQSGKIFQIQSLEINMGAHPKLVCLLLLFFLSCHLCKNSLNQFPINTLFEQLHLNDPYLISHPITGKINPYLTIKCEINYWKDYTFTLLVTKQPRQLTLSYFCYWIDILFQILKLFRLHLNISTITIGQISNS